MVKKTKKRGRPALDVKFCEDIAKEHEEYSLSLMAERHNVAESTICRWLKVAKEAKKND